MEILRRMTGNDVHAPAGAACQPLKSAGFLALFAAVLAAIQLMACGCDGGSSTPGDGNDSAGGELPFAPAGPDSAPDPLAAGPFPVGVTTVDFTDPSRPDSEIGADRFLRTEIWYPAVQSARGDPPWSYDLKQEAALPVDLGDSYDDFMAADIPPFPSSAVRNAGIDRAGGPYPVLLFSHGAYSLRFQYTYFTEFVASHGYVVVAVDHAGNTLWDMIRDGMDSEALGRSLDDRPKDLRFVLNQIEKANANPESFLFGMADLAHVAASGHSFGGYTAMAAGCLDSRVRLVVLHAPLLRPMPAIGCPFETYPVPVMLMGGTDDATLPWPEQYCTYRRIEGVEKYLVEIEKGGHFTFSDICAFDFSGFPLTGAPDFANDGCSPTDNVPYEQAHMTIDYYATAFMNARLRGSPESGSLLIDRDDPPFDTVNFYVGGGLPDWPEEGGCAAVDGG